MWHLIVVSFFVSVGLYAKAAVMPNTLTGFEPVAELNATQILQYYGYPAELYEVTTPDGYILTVHRIPHGRDEWHRNKSAPSKQVIYLQHGLLAASDCFMLNPPDNSLAMVLADAGYDVWLGNYRGNVYSQQHVTLNPSEKAFWEFSWDEMGKYDLPTMISKALEISGQSQVIYIGHSEGTTGAFVALSTNTTLVSQVKVMVALAPIAYAKHIESPLLILLAKLSKQLDFLFGVFGYENFLAENKLTKFLIDELCFNWGSLGALVCENTLFAVSGFDKAEFNASRNDVYMNHVPAGTSTQNIFHYAQCIETGNFQAFDYGSDQKNEQHYGTPEPPQYVPHNIGVPVALFTSDNDWLSVKPDVDRLRAELPNIVLDFHINFPYWNHLDYLLAVDSRPFYMDPLVSFLNNFTTTTSSSAL